ncbi:hypothetical protein [Aquimarina sp. 2201CG5-10]|uniref:hypothetical protein n=1 Tax=Aquimarina callyspongiae TaxID=3098150 RepID=UPI002AB41928|nr:hypothetical protein [Aquimarina sp. 2201CG5-10]MDY8136606.1 hypothetical protein [Aquimarina sp. 2201CG5-10]
MNSIKSIENHKSVYLSQLKHLKFKKLNGKYVAILRDAKGYEIIKGYGNTTAEAINDLHSTLL